MRAGLFASRTTCGQPEQLDLDWKSLRIQILVGKNVVVDKIEVLVFLFDLWKSNSKVESSDQNQKVCLWILGKDRRRQIILGIYLSFL